MGTKQYERIFQILGAVLLAAVVVGVIAVCFGNGARSGVKREIGASDCEFPYKSRVMAT